MTGSLPVRAGVRESPARSRRLARLADRLTGRDLTERYLIGLRAWDACLRGEPLQVVLHHAGRVLEPFPAAVVYPDSQTVYAELLLARGATKGAAAELEDVDRR
ncbi:hypothetical protein [Streptomyces subrutilus]|uniref:Uncharacterized protein n=1 Tax=Streptomyces subrutilus TaxID=36818 RepID=A0A1E5PMC9_9ACTN|nr:hypothetical protein [Streptomyces subrutilus]OEJ30726.1 hypothetical protein BGK67_04645 [Streptomyces subrutilus]